MFNFEQLGGLKYICAEVRGRGNPLPQLRSLCDRTGWSIVEAGQDGEFLDFDGNALERWGWLDFLDRAVAQSMDGLKLSDTDAI